MIARRTLLAVPVAVTLARTARAQPAWAPDRPIRFIVPYVAGGSTDVAARLIGDAMGEKLGQPVIVENRGGSGGNIGAEIVVRSPPDGHTLLMGTTGLLTTNQHIYRNMTFDPLKDLSPVSMAYTSDMVIVIAPSVQARNLAEFVTLAKAQPGKMSFGSSGHGASTHTAAELFKLAAGIQMEHVPYRGSAAAMNDLMSGTLEMIVVQIAPTVGLIQANKIRPLAVTGPKRHPLLPDVPTVGELGYPNAESTSWGCVVVPAGTPAPAIQRLNAVTREAVANPIVARRMAEAGVDGVSSTAAELADFLRKETEKWSRVVKEAHITVE
jgi:tripartite-type tricarboxylate transporter receptor subunit TctC